MTREGAAVMAVTIVFICLCLAALLIFAGAAEIERKADRWERYEKWIHPPDDDDGVSLLEEEDDDADSR